MSILKSEGDLKQLLADIAEEIKDFDTLHAGDTDYQDKAKSKLKDILAWLYLIGKDKVKATLTVG